jgi:hypothetical protein
MGNSVEINKRRLRFSCQGQGTTFVLFQAVSQSGKKHTFRVASLVRFLARQEMNRGKYFIIVTVPNQMFGTCKLLILFNPQATLRHGFRY